MTSDERPSAHPALAGREQGMGALADAVRRLMELTTTCNLPPGMAESVAAELQAAGDRMAAHVPDVHHLRFVVPPGVDDWDPSVMYDAMPYDVVIGRYNPLALPLAIDIERPKALGRATFTKAYEGAPGWVHGAILAGAFDLVLTAANYLEEAAGPTVSLSVRYRRPTLLDEECLFEGWVDRRQGNRVVSKGHLMQRGVVTVEAEGEFAVRPMRPIVTAGPEPGTS